MTDTNNVICLGAVPDGTIPILDQLANLVKQIATTNELGVFMYVIKKVSQNGSEEQAVGTTLIHNMRVEWVTAMGRSIQKIPNLPDILTASWRQAASADTLPTTVH